MVVQPKYRRGEIVRKKISKDIIGEIILDPQLNQGIYFYRIRLRENQIILVSEDALEPYEDLKTPEDHFNKKSFSNRESFTRIITYNKLVGGYQNNPTSLMSSKTLFEPHQYKPLLKFLYSDSQRLLIADEVGLGKTIEAGHILLELNSRNSLKIVFVICPKSICIKWQRELSDKFSMFFEIIDKKRIMKFLDDYERGITPKEFYAIISYQSVRVRGVRERLIEVNPEIDLVILDEMHWARNETSLTHRIAKQISEFSTAVLGLTATPVMIGSANLFNLLSILNPFEFQNESDFNSILEENRWITYAIRALGLSEFKEACELLRKLEQGPFREQFINSPIYQSLIQRLLIKDISREENIKLLKDATELSLLSNIVTRTRRKEVQLKAIRDSKTFRLTFTDFEKNFYDWVTEYVREKYSLYSADTRGTNFALMMPQRQVASCIPAMFEYYKGMFEKALEDDENEEYSDLSSINNEQENENIADSSYKNEIYQKILAQLNENPNPIDSKYSEMIKAIKYIHISDPSIKILIFSYFRATVQYLSNQLKEDGYSNYLMSGGVVAEERQKIMDDFRHKDDIKILISTEVGNEGIDLEFCSVVINYDLPWNPMVVEQRIGRIDRFGQKSDKITVINFAVEETIEARILDRLYDRIEIFRESIGDLEDILGEEIHKLTIDLLTHKLTPEQQEARIEEASNIIISRKIDAKKLEEESAGLLTNDEFFKQELSNILTERRYITHEEILIYINEYLRKKHIQCVIKSTLDDHIMRMYISSELENEMRDYFKKNNKPMNELIGFISKAGLSEKREIELTFNSEFALNNQKIEFINAYHPLITFVTGYYKDYGQELLPCAAILIERTDLVEPGYYYYFTFEFLIGGGRYYKSLAHIFLNSNGNESVSESKASELIAHMIIKGRSLDRGLINHLADLEPILEAANQISTNRFLKIRAEIIELNESTIKKQLDITNRIFDTKIKRLRETIDEVQYNPTRARIVPALEGQIRKLTNDKNTKILEIEKKREIEDQTRLVAAGILVIQ